MTTDPRQISGFSMLSLLIGSLLGVFLTASIGTLIYSSVKSYAYATAVTEMHENGRYALNLLTLRLRMAGAVAGCASGITFKNVLSSTPFHVDVTKALEGFESTGASSWSMPLSNVGLAAGTTPGNFVRGGTDFLMLRRTTGDATPLEETMANPSADLEVADDLSPAPFATGDIVIVSDYQKCSLFQISAFASGTGIVSHDIGVQSPGNSVANLTDGGEVYDNSAGILSLMSDTFYVGTGVDSEPTLYLKTGNTNGVEVISGVEDMQVLFGEDLDGDLSADRYLAANAVANMANVVSVRVHLLVRTKEEVNHENGSYYFMGATVQGNDRRLRKEFTTVMQLRNKG